ncbi:MAG: hypothetical protein AAF151_22645, partial [Cyanobacteria bacterium J06656_5]
ETTIHLLCELLNNYLSFSNPNIEGEIAEDYSSHWLPIIDGDSRRSHEVDSILGSFIWDTAISISDIEPNQSKRILQEFSNYRWRIFDRISLHLLRRYPKYLSEHIDERLKAPNRLGWLGFYLEGTGVYYSHEHALLLSEQFSSRSVEIQGLILDLLVNDPSEVPSEKRDEYIRYWRRDWLSVLEGKLPNHLEKRHKELVEELGVPYTLDAIFSNPRGEFYGGPNSPKSGSELSEMAESDFNGLIAYLKEWKPPQKSRHQSQNDLAWSLADGAITPNPQKFVNGIELFKELDKPFIIWLLRGLKKALENPSNEEIIFSWEPVVGFCKWILENLQDVNQNSSKSELSDWNQVCDAVVEIVDTGISVKGVSRITLALRTQIWGILEALTSDRFVTPSFTPQYQGTNMGAYQSAINTVRGKAMQAVVRYAAWIRQDIEEPIEVFRNFEDMPEVKRVLEWHLDPQEDPSFLIRSVYGRFFPFLFSLAPDWTQQRINLIFPERPDFKDWFDAAWEGYLFNRLYIDVVNILRGKYNYAVKSLSLHAQSNRCQSESSKFLTNHLFFLFWSGNLNLGENDNLLEFFLVHAPKEARENFMWSFGWEFLYGKFEGNDEEQCKRLQNFLEWRIRQAQEFKSDKEQFSDLKYLSWIVASGELDNQWAIDKLIDVLDILGTVDQCDELLNHFEELAHALPQKIIKCISLLAEYTKAYEWFARHRRSHYTSIFQTVLASRDEKAHKATEDLISRLLARNFGNYRDLLLE